MHGALSILFITLISYICSVCKAEDQWLYQSEEKWNEQWKSGAWSYMDKVPVERSKIAIIGSVLIPMYSEVKYNNISVLDIGCGEGAISDFLNLAQNSRYVGVDI
mmetsp:Transcript_31366/g.45106  ORF Transcript_31366/g.45106 Transcript_31366/m.45106 type:complete len:105 (-) Transcript_31366:2054-2368(-)